jgi:general secretion pathway protein N
MMLRWTGLAAVALAAILLTILMMAPAQWLATATRAASGGRLDLAEASGTLWNGQATLVVASGSDLGASRASLPEPLSWHLSPWQLLIGTVDLTLSHPSALTPPLSIRVSPGGEVRVSATTLRVPASLLTGLGAPFNTIRPGGTIAIAWDGLQLAGGKMQGVISAEWQFASSNLSPVSPFGHYLMQTNGVFPGTELTLQTVSGPLELTGSGTIPEGGRLHFEGRAQALPGTDPGVKAQLAGLLSLLGRRDGEAAILRFGN